MTPSLEKETLYKATTKQKESKKIQFILSYFKAFSSSTFCVFIDTELLLSKGRHLFESKIFSLFAIRKVTLRQHLSRTSALKSSAWWICWFKGQIAIKGTSRLIQLNLETLYFDSMMQQTQKYLEVGLTALPLPGFGKLVSAHCNMSLNPTFTDSSVVFFKWWRFSPCKSSPSLWTCSTNLTSHLKHPKHKNWRKINLVWPVFKRSWQNSGRKAALNLFIAHLQHPAQLALHPPDTAS